MCTCVYLCSTACNMPSFSVCVSIRVQAFKACQAGLMLNVDTATTAFLRSGRLPEVMKDVVEFRWGRRRDTVGWGS